MVLALALVAGACAGGDEEERGAPEGAEGGGPKYGGTLVVAATDPGPLNPAITSAGTTHPVTGQIFNGLVRLDLEFKPQPDLARNWTVSDDGRVYTFDLVRDARWHDGQPFTSADVKYTFEQVLVKEHPRTRVALGPILEGIDTPDEHTVVFRLKERYTPFLVLIDEDNGGILPKHLFEGTDPRTNPVNSRPVGTGPFRFESEVEGDRITLVRNPDYFKQGRPYLDRVVFRIIPNPPQELQAFQAGEIDFFNPSPPDVERVRAMPATVVSERGQEAFGTVIRLIPNQRRKPFDDVRVRQAMAYAIDKEFIAKTVYAGVRKPATGPITRTLEPFYTDEVRKYPRDLERARALLDEAGLPPGPDGVRLRASLIFDQGFARTADLLKQQLGEVGIALDLQLMEFQAWVNKLYLQNDFEFGYSQLTDAPDPDIGTKRAYTCDNIAKVPFANGAAYCNPRVDELFKQAAREEDLDKRVELYAEVQRLIVEDQPHIFLVDGVGPYAHDAEFQGFAHAGAKARYYFGDTVWWTKGSASSTPGNDSGGPVRGGG